MLQINGLSEGLEIFKALGSEVRMKIVELLSENEEMSLNEIASSLKLTSGAVTSHIRKLEECGIIQISQQHTSHGLRKNCSLRETQLLLNVYPASEERVTKAYETEVPVGHYSDYSVRPGCGLAGLNSLIGTVDDPRCFAWPERVEAEMLWFHDGFVEYRIPNLLPEGQRIVQVTLSFEVSSADQAVLEQSRSDILFYLNGQPLGHWLTVLQTDPAKGIYTPMWWNRPERQHGYLKMLVVNEIGVFLDGVKIEETGSGWSFLDENGEMKLRFEVLSTEDYSGGIALYGSRFGNYSQNIHARVHYMPEELPEISHIAV
ncbi:MAG: helix-turn-helix domain-containing protein [Blautia sp.]|nr:helix-turn-helix domain-containing protein [Blautia sp.]